MKVKEVRTEAQVRRLIEAIQASPQIAVDTESTGAQLVGKNFINTLKSTLTGISISSTSHAWYVATGHRVKVCRWDLIRSVLKCISDHPCVYFHNAKHDLIVWEDYTDVPFPKNFRDTMLEAWLLGYAETTGLGLKALAKALCKLEWGDFEGATKGRPAAQLTPKQLSHYAGMDAYATWKLGELLTPQLGELEKPYQEIELPFVRVLADIERKGVAINRDRLLRLFESIYPRKQKIETWWESVVGGSINSPIQVANRLYGDGHWDKTGLKPRKTGAYPTDAKTIKGHIAKCKPGSVGHLAALKKQEYQVLTKIASTYTLGLIENAEQYPDKRLHPSYHQAGTATGRLSSSYPNAQNIPARSELGMEVMSSFVAGPGSILVGADYSQIEYRICAHYVGGGLAEAYSQGSDMHSKTAADLDISRDHAKTMNFALLYGAQDNKISESLGCTKKRAREIRLNMLKANPEIVAFRNKILAGAYRDGYVTSLSGRKRYFPDMPGRGRHEDRSLPFKELLDRWEDERKAFNMIFQGSAADICKAGMVSLHQNESNGLGMTAQIHDQVICEHTSYSGVAPGSDLVGQLSAGLSYHLESAWDLDVPLVAEAKAGSNWKAIK